jgi:hypothetical protein
MGWEDSSSGRPEEEPKEEEEGTEERTRKRRGRTRIVETKQAKKTRQLFPSDELKRMLVTTPPSSAV